ncbi:MAG TPA: hypothetical protein VFV39_01895 [Limnobacter sp.]|nr:hypothetical protein [Limnobacter sp.]
MAAFMVSQSALDGLLIEIAEAGDDMTEEALNDFLEVLEGNPTPGQVAHAAATLGINLDTAAKIMQACGKTAEFINQVYQAAR